MSMSKTFAAAEVTDFVVQDYATNELLLLVQYAQDVKVTGDASELEITGGIGNPTLMTLFHSKKSEFTATLPLVSMDCLGTKLGKKVVKGATITPKSEILTVDASNKISLSQTPLIGTLTVNKLDGARDVGDKLTLGDHATKPLEYSIVAKDITLNTAVTAGTKIVVVYDYMSGVNASKVTFTAKDFPPLIKISAVTNIEDEEGNKCPMALKVYKTKVSPKFEMSFKAGEASNIAFECKNMADAHIEGTPFFDLIALADEDPIDK